MTWTVSYSQTQGAFHIETMQDTTRKNIECILKGMPCDYLVIGFFPTHEQAAEFINCARRMMDVPPMRVDENGKLNNL